MTVRTEIHASIPPRPRARNADPRREVLPVLARLRARTPGTGAGLVAVVWMLVLAFFVLGVAAPAAILARRAGPAATQVASAAR